jgi:hypothetical protein
MAYSEALSSLVDGYDAGTATIIPPVEEDARPRCILVRPTIISAKVKADSHEKVSTEKLASLPLEPIDRPPPSAEPYRSLGKKYNVCGVELEFIMKALLHDENETVDRAFRQFLMIAKLSAVEPLEQAHTLIRNTDDLNRTVRETWISNTAAIKQRNAALKRRLTQAKKAMDAPWQGVLSTLKTLLEEDNRVESLHPHDFFMVQAMQKHMGKKLVVIRDGKIRIKFDDLKILNADFGLRVMETALAMSDRYHANAVQDWLNDRKNVKQIREILESPMVTKLKTQEVNEMTRIVLAADKRIIIVTADGDVCDGGPRIKGQPHVVYEQEERWNSYSKNGGYQNITIDFGNRSVWELERIRRHLKDYTS